MTRTSPILFATLIVGCMLLAPHAWGQDRDEDGPALGVARVSLINGDVTARRGDSGDWIEAEVNLPLVEGDSIATGRASRAEVQLDYSNLLRLHEQARVNLAELANRRFRVQLEQGMVTYSELRGGEADIDIETALVAVRPRKRGQYRVEVFGDQRVIVTVREGEAEIASADGIETLKQGSSMIVRAGEAGTQFQNVKAEPKDDWDRWNERRDDQLRKSESRRYVSESVYGVEDLDGHGRWTYVSGYGRTWFPLVAVGWAPYRHGRWVWLDYYGWSWVGYEPWGWAPYHYGRWYHHAGYGWGWYPGPRYSRHYWRPALVSFFGYGSRGGFGIGIGFGNVGWVPLAPGERYHPWYGRRFHSGFRGGGRHNTTIFVDNSVNIVNNYRNARHHNGVTVVEGNRFGDRGSGRAATARDFDGASVMRGQLPIVPGREHQGRIVRAGNGVRGDDQRDGARGTTFFNSGRAARSVERTSFERQQEQIRTSVRSFGESSQGGNGNPGAGIAATESARSQRDRSSQGGSAGTAPDQTPARAGIRSGGPEFRGGSAEATPGADSSQTPGAARSAQRDRSGRSGQDAASSGGIRSGGQGFPSASSPRTRSGGDTSTATPGASRDAASPSVGGSRTRSRFDAGTESSGGWQSFGNRGGRASRSSDSPARVDSSGAQAEPERRSSSRGFARSEPRVDTSGRTGISSSPAESSRSRPSREQSPSAREPRSSGGSEVFAPRSGSRVDESSRGSRSRTNVTPDSGPSGVREQDRGRSMQTRPSREASPGATSRPSASRSQSGVSSSPSRGGSGRSSMSGGAMSGGSRSGGSMSGGSVSRGSSASRGSASRGSMSSGGGGGRSSGGGGGGGSISAGGGSRGGRGR
jgi:hypothetical protein